jgi:hypothetical protein
MISFLYKGDYDSSHRSVPPTPMKDPVEISGKGGADTANHLPDETTGPSTTAASPNSEPEIAPTTDAAADCTVDTTTSPVISPKIAPAPTHELNVHHYTRVYLVAQEYEVPLLRDLALERVEQWIESNWKNEEFPKALREIFEMVPFVYHDFHELILHIITSHCDTLIGSSDVWRIIRDGDLFRLGRCHGDFFHKRSTRS